MLRALRNRIFGTVFKNGMPLVPVSSQINALKTKPICFM
jgi:hypothetical protein